MINFIKDMWALLLWSLMPKSAKQMIVATATIQNQMDTLMSVIRSGNFTAVSRSTNKEEDTRLQ